MDKATDTPGGLGRRGLVRGDGMAELWDDPSTMPEGHYLLDTGDGILWCPLCRPGMAIRQGLLTPDEYHQAALADLENWVSRGIIQLPDETTGRAPFSGFRERVRALTWRHMAVLEALKRRIRP